MTKILDSDTLHIQTSELVQNTSEGFRQFFLGLFARHEFTSHLLERSFRQPIGWVEMGTVAAIALLTYWLSTLWIARFPINYSNRISLLRHIGQRILWPVLILIITLGTLIAWNALGYRAVWLRLLLLGSQWMILIRLVLALLHAALPSSKLTDWLERTMSGLLWVYFLVWVSGIDDIIINWMKNLKFNVGSTTLNLYTILSGVIWIGIIMVMAMWLANLARKKLMASHHFDINLRIMLSNVIRTLLMVLSVLIALPLVGIDLTVLSVFGGALGVGIGFGLQKIASNYISGFMILGDRSIRPGDRLTVDNFTGYVTKITSRFVVLRSATGSEALVPNETFVTSMVINESYTSKALWQSLDVQIAYHSDVVRAMQIMTEAAESQDQVAKDPKPSTFLTGFADNGINLKVSFWVSDPENGYWGLFSAILLDIWTSFNAEGIEFPYPQREIRILNQDNAPSEAAMLRANLQAHSPTQSLDPQPHAAEGEN